MPIYWLSDVRCHNNDARNTCFGGILLKYRLKNRFPAFYSVPHDSLLPNPSLFIIHNDLLISPLTLHAFILKLPRS